MFLDKSLRDGVNRGPVFIEDFQLAPRIKPIIGEERRYLGRGMLGIVVRELCQGKDVKPVVLLIVAKGSQILFEDLVDTFRLSVRLGVKGRRLVTLNVADVVERGCKARRKLGSPI